MLLEKTSLACEGQIKKCMFSLTSFIIVPVLKGITLNKMNDPRSTCLKGSTKWRGKDECLAVEISIFTQINLCASLPPQTFSVWLIRITVVVTM